MPPDPVHQLNRSARQADFTYTMVLDVLKIQDTGKGEKSVADDLAAVLRKIEDWHQGSIAGYWISFREAQDALYQVNWEGKEARVCRA
ncbi:MAG: hypothetical protein WB586_25500 [Chthoniobacterales bacterium]